MKDIHIYCIYTYLKDKYILYIHVYIHSFGGNFYFYLRETFTNIYTRKAMHEHYTRKRMHNYTLIPGWLYL